MTDEDTEKCGHPTGDGEPCQNPASEGDSCWIDAHGGTVSIGRDPKLTKSRQESIASMLEDGQSVAAACRCNNISRQTFYDWLHKGDEQDEGIYADFADRVASARGAGERQLVDELLEMVREKGDTRTMLSILKSRYPDSWGDAEAVEEGGTININLSPEQEADQ